MRIEALLCERWLFDATKGIRAGLCGKRRKPQSIFAFIDGWPRSRGQVHQDEWLELEDTKCLTERVISGHPMVSQAAILIR
jgi:hypothetical protein